MKKILNIKDSKILFVILLLTLSFIFTGKTFADSCNEVSWLAPLESFPGAQGNAVGYVSPADGISCDTTCGIIGSECLGSYNVNVNSVGSVGSSLVYICSQNDKCSNGDPDGNNSSSTSDGRSVIVSIVTPKLGITDEHLPTKPDAPVDVDVTVKWWTSKKTSGASDFEKCEASSGVDGNGGKWEGSKNPDGGTENLGKVPLYEDNVFKITCYFHDDGGIEQKTSSEVSIMGSDNNLIISSTLGGTIIDMGLDKIGVSKGLRVHVVGAGMSVSDALWLTPVGSEAIVLNVLKRYAFVRTGINAVKTLPELFYKFCGLSSCAPAINYYKLKIFGQSTIDLSKFTTDGLLSLKKYLAEQTAKDGIEFAITPGMLRIGEKDTVSIEGMLGEYWHTHSDSILTPSGPMMYKQAEIVKNKLLTYAKREFGSYLTDQQAATCLEGIKGDWLFSKLYGSSGDIMVAIQRGQKTFGVGTISKTSEFVEHTWKTLSPNEYLEAVINPVSIEVNGMKYNKTAMDLAWGDDGWVNFYIENGVK